MVESSTLGSCGRCLEYMQLYFQFGLLKLFEGGSFPMCWMRMYGSQFPLSRKLTWKPRRDRRRGRFCLWLPNELLQFDFFLKACLLVSGFKSTVGAPTILVQFCCGFCNMGAHVLCEGFVRSFEGSSLQDSPEQRTT